MKTIVQVLLSSYNGARYINEQLDSILGQEALQVKILIRDDGSSDETRNTLSNYAKTYDNIEVVYGENLGVIRSFFTLIDLADGDAPYIAFSDQDDVWLPDKLVRAVNMIQQEEKKDLQVKAVYCSRVQLVDENLQPMKSAIRYSHVRTEFGNALVENMCTGCTCVVNQNLIQLIKGKQPQFTVMHDFWIYLVGTCFGKVIYDESSRILYRQHGNNELGAASSLFENYKKRVRYFKVHRFQLSRQAEEILNVYGKEMRQEEIELVKDIVDSRSSRKVRRKLIREGKVFRQRKSDDLIFKVLLILGKI